MRKTNVFIDLTGMEARRRKEAYSLGFDPKSKRWKAYLCQGIEVSVLRDNFQHGHISLGWDDFDKKIIIGDAVNDYGEKNKDLRIKYMIRARIIAEALNKDEGLN